MNFGVLGRVSAANGSTRKSADSSKVCHLFKITVEQ